MRRVNMHSLRQSFASALIMPGAPVTEVQSLLGHSGPAVTTEGLLALVQECGDRFGGPAGKESDGGRQKSWTVFAHFRACSPDKYRVSI
ncbi:MAG: tyrosine-type recombinase/integrase [Candidatus Binataceae bacterium]